MANANLLARFAQPVRSVQDFQDDYMRQDMQQQGLQRNALLLQEGQALQQDRERTRMEGETLRNALMAAGPNASLAQRAAAARATGLQSGYKFADEWEKSDAEIGAKRATTGETVQKTQAGAFKLDAEKDAQARKLLQVATNPEHAMQMIDAAVEKGFWTTQDADLVKRGISRDVAQFEQSKMRQLAPALSPDKLLPTNGNVDLGGSRGFTSTNPLDGRVTMTGSAPVTQDANSIASNATQVRGQNLTDARARDFNAVQVEGNNIKRAEVTQTKDLTKNSQLASFDTMLGTLDRLAKHPGLSKSVGIPGVFPTMPGSNSANFQAELNTFQSQAFLPMVAQLKGMGALSDAEGKKLTAAVGALDPKMGEVAFRESVDRITEEMTAARERVAGTGGAPKPAAKSGPAVGAIEGGHRFKGGNPADPKNWEKQ